MKIRIRNLSFGYAGKNIFNSLNVDLAGASSRRPLVILGPSGSGKTTLLKLAGGLLKPEAGDIHFCAEDGLPYTEGSAGTAFMFQESRLLPWKTVLENVSLPLEKIFGREKARERARHFLSLVSLAGKENTRPAELSGGEAQRVSMARAFAWPTPVLLMDEPFQSLDIPLRKNLMDLTLRLLENETRLLVAVTHEPREAVYMGGRIIVLGKRGEGIALDRDVDLSSEDRAYGSNAASEMEGEVIRAMSE